MRPLVTSILVLALGVTGCAGLEMRNIVSDTDDNIALGFRYYDTSPFLLIYTDGKGGLKSEILYLPDSTKKHSIRPYSYGATNDATFTFKEGRLTGAKATVDETVLPVAAVSALEKVATSLVKAANAGNEGIPGPYLFRIRKEGAEWKLTGGQAINQNGGLSVIRYVAP